MDRLKRTDGRPGRTTPGAPTQAHGGRPRARTRVARVRGLRATCSQNLIIDVGAMAVGASGRFMFRILDSIEQNNRRGTMSIGKLHTIYETMYEERKAAGPGRGAVAEAGAAAGAVAEAQ